MRGIRNKWLTMISMPRIFDQGREEGTTMPDAMYKAGTMHTGLENYLGVDDNDPADAYNALDYIGLTSDEIVRTQFMNCTAGINAALERINREAPFYNDLEGVDPRLRLITQAYRLEALKDFFPDWQYIAERMIAAALKAQLPTYGMIKQDNTYTFTADDGGAQYSVRVTADKDNKAFNILHRLLKNKGNFLLWKQLDIHKSGREARDEFLRTVKRVPKYLEAAGLLHLAKMVDGLIPRFAKGKKDPWAHRSPEFGGKIVTHRQNTGAMLTRAGRRPTLDAGYPDEAVPPGWKEIMANMDNKAGVTHYQGSSRYNPDRDPTSEGGRNPYVPHNQGGTSQSVGVNRGRFGHGSIVQDGDYRETEGKDRKSYKPEEPLNTANAVTQSAAKRDAEPSYMRQDERQNMDVKVTVKKSKKYAKPGE